MTSSSPVRVPWAIEIPELGPAIGRVALPGGSETSPAARLPLDVIRLELASAIFDMAADARSWSSAGDRQEAVDALAPSGWVAAWETTVRQSAEYAANAIDHRIRGAARESRIPKRRLRRLLLTDAEKRAIAARLGRGGTGLTLGLEALEVETGRMREAGVLDRDANARWRTALIKSGHALESAWLQLEGASVEEWNRWTPLVESVRAWRRPRWLLALLTISILGVALYLGLVIGGYLQGPPFLDPVAEWWWTWWDRLVEPA
jgi:hypothetical protein